MVVLFENLTPFCMLVIELFQSSIASSRMRELGGAVLASLLLDSDRLLLEDHTLYWSRGGAGSCTALSVICD